MSHFSISAEQRQRLLAGDYRPLVFDILPYGCQTGARYVVVRQRARKIAVRDENDIVGVADIPEVPLFWITVTEVLGGPDRRWERPDGDWLVRFDVEDRRDVTVYLKAATGYTTSRRDAVDPLPVVVDDAVRQKTMDEVWHARRLARFALEQKARSRARRQRRAA